MRDNAGSTFRFADALNSYKEARADCRNACQQRDDATDDEIGIIDARETNAALALVQSGAKGPEAARALLEIAVERYRAARADDFNLDPTSSYGIDDRLDVAFITAALAALTPDAAEGGEGK